MTGETIVMGQQHLSLSQDDVYDSGWAKQPKETPIILHGTHYIPLYILRTAYGSTY
jgi:hypothetical protein